MIALPITAFVILLSYILYAGTAESLSATYCKSCLDKKDK